MVDNASTDGSSDGLEQRFPGVQVLRPAKTSGLPRATTSASRPRRTATWIACLNPDAFPEPDWLAQWAAAAERLPGYAFFGCKLLQADGGDVLDGTGDCYHVSGLAWRRDHGKPETEAHGDGEIFAPCAAAALYRRDVLLDAAGFDRSYFCYFEDVDLAFRLRLRGHRCYYVSAARVHHVGSAIAGRGSDFSVYHGHRNLVWTYFKNMPGVLFWLYLPLHIALNVASIVYFALQGRPGVILRAKGDALRGLPRVLEQKRREQAARTVKQGELRRAMTTGLRSLFQRN